MHKRITACPLTDRYIRLWTIFSKTSNKVARFISGIRLFIFVRFNRVRFFPKIITHFFGYWILLMECATFQMCKNTKYNGVARANRFSWTYTMIKKKRYSIKYLWKIDFGIKTSWWEYQDLNIHLILNVERIETWLILWIC